MKKILLLVAMAAALTGCGADDYDWDATKAKATEICLDFGGKIKYMEYNAIKAEKFAFYAKCINTSTGNEFGVGFPGVRKEGK